MAVCRLVRDGRGRQGVAANAAVASGGPKTGVRAVRPAGRGVMGDCEGTSENQWSNTPKPLASPFSTGTCSGV
jgi:hypothetical protein